MGSGAGGQSSGLPERLDVGGENSPKEGNRKGDILRPVGELPMNPYPAPQCHDKDPEVSRGWKAKVR